MINVAAQVTHLSQKEFDRIGTKGIENPNIDDFRNFILRVELSNSDNVTEKKLVVPDTAEFKDLLSSDRLWFGDELNQNNDREDLSLAERNYVLFYRDLTDEALIQMLSPIRFHMSWVDSNGVETSKDYKLVDYLVFK